MNTFDQKLQSIFLNNKGRLTDVEIIGLHTLIMQAYNATINEQIASGGQNKPQKDEPKIKAV